MGNIIQQCPTQGKEKCKYITKYVFFFLFQALLIVCGFIILVSVLTPTCQHSNPNSCGCNLISSMNSGISVPCQTTGTYVPFNDICYANNQYYCCDSCSLSLGVCIVCSSHDFEYVGRNRISYRRSNNDSYHCMVNQKNRLKKQKQVRIDAHFENN